MVARPNIVKVRLSDEEQEQIDRMLKKSGLASRADYMRRAALGGATNAAVAETIGEVGIALNRFGKAPQKQFERIVSSLDRLVDIMQDKEGER
ncbi:plasmid mobilization protein [Celeribacter halophilus]|uniref:Ribbon-helix-helix protein, copG family n=1 Tax=Celeribacter halophilus TaxID=576117 RepID=A0A1I3XI64_9RHOB|nr:ribbon-helix-helix protein, CopG family [Celeribacter halophilus]PZX06031.1 ribbon-helix-helix CopG family protein [Celeribacter halophilus]SFK18756.1 Ribbon-helix-helix protein, copG family [Celeribacter halophilus]